MALIPRAHQHYIFSQESPVVMFLQLLHSQRWDVVPVAVFGLPHHVVSERSVIEEFPRLHKLVLRYTLYLVFHYNFLVLKLIFVDFEVRNQV